MAGISPTAADLSETFNLLEWDEYAVTQWLASIGFPQYQQQIIENGISGEILSLLDHEGLKEVGIHSVGQRLTILKEVYHLKVAHGITIEPEHYVPPSEVIETLAHEGVSLDRLHEIIQELGDRTRTLEDDNRKLVETLNYVMDTLTQAKTNEVVSSYSGTITPGPSRLGHRLEVDSPQTSPARPDHDISSAFVSQIPKPTRTPHTPHGEPVRTPLHRSQSHSHFAQSQQQAPSSSHVPKSQGIPSSSTPSAEKEFKSFKVSLEDPCWKVLPAALKKYKINDDWRKYVMFICHGSTERCLSYDEKPLLLFQKLKDANKNPVFMLRHIKDIRSPISAVAQQKQSQQRREASTPPTPGGSRPSTAPVGSATNGSSYSRNTRLHQPTILHPISAQAQAAKTAEEDHDEPRPHPPIAETLAAAPPGPQGYAIAIYPYVPDQDDEYEVSVDDTFIIRARHKGWWVVQRDVDGTGAPSPLVEDAPRWIPAGCLLETSLPPMQAIAETRASVPASTSPSSPSGISTKPILPSHIMSTSFPGMTLMPYLDKGEHELDLARGDVLRVFKRYNHWSYAIKEETGERGWVPSWFVGKYTPGASSTPSVVPPTPGPSSNTQTNGSHTPNEAHSSEYLGFHHSTNGNGNGHGGGHGSPMSQAFPPSQQQQMRSAVTLI